MLKKIFLLMFLCLGAFAKDASIGVVNFQTCIMESKYGKYEQEQLEKVKKQWSSLIEDTEKQFKEVSSKLEDTEYLESLSADAKKELQEKQQSLGNDLSKYQSQLYQMLNQAQYFFIQKMFANISKASEEVAKKNDLKMLLNKEVFFYYAEDDMDQTNKVITEMDAMFAKEQAVSENTEEKPADTEKKEEIAK
jgi:Skp family chaperone for outer membrane proteins